MLSRLALASLLLVLAGAPSFADDEPASTPESRMLQEWHARIDEARARGDDARVIAFCVEALREFPRSPSLLNAKSTAESRTGDFLGGLISANWALASDPKNAIAHANKALALAGRGDPEGALAALRAASALDPGFEAPLKAALAGDGFNALAVLTSPPARRKPVPPYVWVLIPALAGGSFMFVILGAAWLFRPRAAPLPPVRQIEVEVGTLLAGRYRVDAELGRGGTGVVAFDEKLQRRVAIRQLERDEHAPPAELAAFAREARSLMKLEHPNLARLHDVLDVRGELLLVYELSPGRTLDRLIWAQRKLAPAQTEDILAGVAAALDRVHALAVVHRDLRPTNIMIAGDGSPKILDFGVARESRGPGAPGAEPYEAPEKGAHSRAADLYSLGVTAYHMLTGGLPFEGPDFYDQKRRFEFTPASKREGSLPAGFDAFFASVLNPDPSRRPVSGAGFVAAFRRARG